MSNEHISTNSNELPVSREDLLRMLTPEKWREEYEKNKAMVQKSSEDLEKYLRTNVAGFKKEGETDEIAYRSLIHQTYDSIGEELKKKGIDLNTAKLADINAAVLGDVALLERFLELKKTASSALDSVEPTIQRLTQEVQAETTTPTASETITTAEIDHADMVGKTRKVARDVMGLVKTPSEIPKTLQDDNVFSFLESGLRSALNMTPKEVATVHMFDFITSFRAGEVKERGLFTPETFGSYLKENSPILMNFFGQKAGPQAFLRFFQDSPSSAEQVFDAIDRRGEDLTRLDNGMQVLDKYLVALENTTLRKDLRDTLRKDIAPLMKEFNIPTTENLTKDIGALRNRMQELRDIVDSLKIISDMPLNKKAAYLSLLREAKAGRMTWDAAMIGLFAVELLLTLGGGVIPNEAGKWAGPVIIDWVKARLPQIGFSLTDQQLYGAIIPALTAITSMSAAAHVVTQVRLAQERERVAAENKENLVALPEAEQQVRDAIMQRNNDAMDIAGLSDASQELINAALLQDTPKLERDVWENSSKIGTYRDKLFKVRNETAADLNKVQQTPEQQYIAAIDLLTKDTTITFKEGDAATQLKTLLKQEDVTSLVQSADAEKALAELETQLANRINANVLADQTVAQVAKKIVDHLRTVLKSSPGTLINQQANKYLRRLAEVFNQINEVRDDQVQKIIREEMDIEKSPHAMELPEVTLRPPETPVSTIVSNVLMSTKMVLEGTYARAFGPNWRDEVKFKDDLVFGDALFNSLLRAIFKDPDADYTKGAGVSFSTADLSNWPIKLSEQADKLKLLTAEQKALLKTHVGGGQTDQLQIVKMIQDDGEFPVRLNEAMKKLMLGATKQYEKKLNRQWNPQEDADYMTDIQKRELWQRTNGVLMDTGLTPEEQQAALQQSKDREAALKSLEAEQTALLPALNAIVTSLRGNTGFEMLSVLRVNLLGQKDPTEAMKFLGKQLELSMKNSNGPAAFVEAWSVVQRKADMGSLLERYAKAQETAFHTGVSAPELQKLEGEVGALRALTALDASDLITMVDIANQPNGWAIASGGLFLGKLALAIFGWERVASAFQLPDFSKWQWPQLPEWLQKLATGGVSAAPAAAPAASGMMIDYAGIAWAVGLWGSTTAAAIGATRDAAFENHDLSFASPRAEKLNFTSLGIPMEKLIAERFNITLKDGAWRFNDEAEQIGRLDRMLTENSPNMQSIRAALMAKYGVNTPAALREKMTQEIAASYKEKKQAILKSLGDFIDREIVQKEADARNLQGDARAKWLEEQKGAITSYVEYLRGQFDK